METSINTGLDRAIQAAGGITALARGLGVKSHAVIQHWRRHRVPAEHCPAIEGFTGVRCEELRPDIAWAVLRGTEATPQPTEQGVV